MSLPLLTTKFYTPPVGDKQISRPQLLGKLNDGWEQKASLFLICGPAGYGKTSIVTEWLGSSQILSYDQYAWLALDRTDDDLTRFLTYFVSAVQRIQPGYGEGVLRMLKSHKPQPPAVLATLLINELCAIPRRFLLVLDDYHQLTAQPIQAFMNFFIEHQPPQMSLVLITRSDPPLPLARLRAKGQLIELRQDDLRFGPAEVAEYLNQSMDLGLTHAQIDLLAVQTEGWISGLQLAAISLREEPDRNSFLRAFSGEH